MALCFAEWPGYAHDCPLTLFQFFHSFRRSATDQTTDLRDGRKDCVARGEGFVA